MISGSANRLNKKGCTSSSLSGPPRLSRRTPTLSLGARGAPDAAGKLSSTCPLTKLAPDANADNLVGLLLLSASEPMGAGLALGSLIEWREVGNNSIEERSLQLPAYNARRLRKSPAARCEVFPGCQGWRRRTSYFFTREHSDVATELRIVVLCARATQKVLDRGGKALSGTDNLMVVINCKIQRS